MKNVFVVLLIFAVSAPAMAFKIRDPKRRGNIDILIPNFQGGGNHWKSMTTENPRFATGLTNDPDSVRSDAEKMVKRDDFKKLATTMVCDPSINKGKTHQVRTRVRWKGNKFNLSSIRVTCDKSSGDGDAVGNVSYKCPTILHASLPDSGYSKPVLVLDKHSLSVKQQAVCSYKVDIVRETTRGCRKLNTKGDFSCTQK